MVYIGRKFPSVPANSLLAWRMGGSEEAAKLAHLLESTSLKKKYMYKNYAKLCIE